MREDVNQGLIWTIPTFTWCDWGKPWENLSEDSRHRDTNPLASPMPLRSLRRHRLVIGQD